MRRTLLITALTAVVVGCAAATAQATFHARNGPIAFRRFDPVSGRFSLLRALPNGSNVKELTALPGFFSDWRADGRRIAFDFFDDAGNEQIATINPDGGDLRIITAGPGIHEVPSWAPNGDSIVFDFSPEPDPNTPGFETRLWTMRADGSHARPLRMSRPGFDVEPSVSPDGRWVAFGRLLISPEGDQRQAVFVVGVESGRVSQLTPWELKAEHPTWSPDSRFVVFNAPVAFDEPESSIQVVRPDGRGGRTILPLRQGFGGHKPRFSPDGTRIVFMCATKDADGRSDEDICVMNADGSHIVDVTNTPDTIENWPSWGPAPRR